ncbi:DMT family transporter [Sneathia sanguinegens]|uniref:DMT family transporter n=1 Tax=Sneathia sanguinegens TaxID=40543 RepID=UPI002889029E|nr:DMT family transporter [Sneathia sanguinegens]
MRKGIADIGLLLVGLLWGLGFIATKIGLNEGISPIYMLALRFTIASIFLLFIFHGTIKKITKKDIRKMFLISIVIFFAYGFQIVGSKYTTASKAAFYTGLNVMFVPYISWMLNRKAPDVYTYISTLLCLVGVGFISYVPNQNLFTLNMGDMLIIISAIFYGIHIALTGFYSKKYTVEKMILIQNTIAALLFLITLGLSSLTGIGGDNVRFLSVNEMLAVAYIGLVTTGICLFLQALFQRYTSSVKASIFLGTESVFAPLFASLILKEVLTKNVIIGGILILIAVVLTEMEIIIKNIKKRRKN